MKRKYIEMKLSIVEKEIANLKNKELSVEVNLRKSKEKQWQLIEQLESLNE